MDLIVLEDDYSNDVETGLTKPINAINEEKLYVAVGKEVKENESLLTWAIQNSGGRIISILHVHQPDDFIPILGEKFHWRSLKEQQIKAYRRIEKQFMLKNLDEYLHFCQQLGVQAEKLYIEMDSIEKGILQLIAEYNIEKLVMGAAADDCYHTYEFNCILIVSDLSLLASYSVVNLKMTELMSKKADHVRLHAPAKCHIWFICKGHLVRQRKCSPQARIHAQNESSTNSRSLTLMDLSTNKCTVKGKEVVLGEGSSHFGMSNGEDDEIPYRNDNETVHGFGPALDLEANCHNWSEILQVLRSQINEISVGSPSHMCRDLIAEQLELLADSFFEQNHHCHLSAAQGKVSEGIHAEAVKRSKELEENLEKVKNDRDKLREELQDAMDQNLILQNKISNYNLVTQQLEEGFVSNAELLQACENERDKLKIQLDHVLKTAVELLDQSAEAASNTDALRFLTTFTFAEIKEATNDFDPTLQMWEGENGSIYKGIVSHTQVEILSKFRHPNIVLLVGVCPEAWAAIYEYLPNGTLEERLNSTGDTPLSWQTRIKIATELCSALVFLHSRSPEKVVHGALKPASILLDSNFTCKISDFRSSHRISHHEDSSPSDELLHSSLYTDPEYITTGVATPSMDLLTGKPAYGVIREQLEDALDENSFDSLLDNSAGDWPFLQAKQLALLALECCKENGSARPDLESDVWSVLESMRMLSRGSTSYLLRDEEHRQAPSYFICPIFQEVMKDPRFAADGYTYEAEALQGWLDSGHDTSPMTNLQLEHNNLVPNHALRSAIYQWRQHC
ncbi:U-box domain-containing protein 33 [Bienertia sinuspersici]